MTYLLMNAFGCLLALVMFVLVMEVIGISMLSGKYSAFARRWTNRLIGSMIVVLAAILLYIGGLAESGAFDHVMVVMGIANGGTCTIEQVIMGDQRNRIVVVDDCGHRAVFSVNPGLGTPLPGQKVNRKVCEDLFGDS